MVFVTVCRDIKVLLMHHLTLTLVIVICVETEMFNCCLENCSNQFGDHKRISSIDWNYSEAEEIELTS